MTQKIVINSCFGGFSLSPAAVKRLAEIKGRPCFFFRQEGFAGPYIAVDDPSSESGIRGLMLAAFDIPNPDDVIPKMNGAEWRALTHEQRAEQGQIWTRHSIEQRPDDRADADLVRVVEELGAEAASGTYAQLKIVEIPAGIEWELDEYDGIESVEEKHQSWA